MTDSTRRFTDRVEAYQKYRPGYPPALLSTLLDKAGLDTNTVVADIGSGTGIFTRLLLDHGLQVAAVEPNTNMRLAAETALSEYQQFTSVDGSAEQTGLEDDSIDLVTAAQALHWFNNTATRAEFQRILKPDGKLALIWNKRAVSEPFQQAYDAILREYAPEYDKVNHMNLDAGDIAGFFRAGSMELLHFDNSQSLDFPGLIGRLKSSSYCPAEDSAQYIPLVTELVNLFDQCAVNGKVNFEYDTQLYFGAVDTTEKYNS